MTTRELARHWEHAASVDLVRVGQHMAAVNGFNTKLAVLITNLVGSMWCAYLFTCLALVGLPGAISAGPSAIVQWVAQTFLQLVLLSIIMVGQQVQSASSDARALKTFEDTEKILDRLSLETQGGLAQLKSEILAEMKDMLAAKG